VARELDANPLLAEPCGDPCASRRKIVPVASPRNTGMSLTALVFVIGLFAGCGLALFRHPIYGLLTYVGVFYVFPPWQWWGHALPELRWSLIVAVVTAFAVLLRRPNKGTRPSIFKQPLFIGFLAFGLWLAVQTLWAMDLDLQLDLLVLFAKYTLLLMLIYACVGSERHLRLFLWTNVLGAAYLGIQAYFAYEGGRFEGFPAPGIDEANSGAIHMVTVVLSAATLFLLSRWRGKLLLFAVMPFLVNSIVVTISRSGFLAVFCGGLMFNAVTPPNFRRLVRGLSVLGVILFMLLTSPVYWARIASLKYAGQDVEGVDTGAGRLVLMQAQLRMFADHPFGCGHRCTAILSRQYLDDKNLTGEQGSRARSSHNTAMTLLVEQGIPGVAMYALLLVGLYRSVGALWKRFKGAPGPFAAFFPCVAAALLAVSVGDVFVDYLKLEVRIWFIGLFLVLNALAPALGTEEGRTDMAGTAGAAVAAGGSGRAPNRRR
jgi:hypothetical protein